MLQPAAIQPTERPCGPTIYLTVPNPSAQIKHNFSKPALGYPNLTTIDGRLFYSFGEKGLDVIDVFCDTVIFIQYHMNRVFGPEFVQIRSNVFIYRVDTRILKIEIDIDQAVMRTIDEKAFERSFGCSERIVGERYIVYQWSLSYEFVCLNLFHIDDIHIPLQIFRLDVESRWEPTFFGLFHIFDEKLFFFSKFGNQTVHNEKMVLNLGALHVYDMNSFHKEIHSTSTLPSFYYTPPANIIRVQRLFIQRAFWIDSMLYLRIKEVENQIPFYHLIVLDITTLEWKLIADVNIEQKLSALIDESGVMTLINVKPGNKEQIYYRIPLRQPESLRNLAHFAVKRNFPRLYKMSIEERIQNGIPPYLPFHPLFSKSEFITCRVNSAKNRFSMFIRRFLN